MRQLVSGCGLLFVAILVAGCDPTYFHSPELTLSGKTQSSLDQPIAIAAADEEADKRDGNYATTLVKAIVNAYPKSTKAVAPNSIPIQGQVSVKINIRRLGALFKRSREPVLFNGEQLNSPRGNVADWGNVVAAAKSQEPGLSGYVAGYGGLSGNLAFVHSWRGLAFLELEVRDLRPERTANFTLPLAAERSTGNGFGYLQAAMNADEAWQVVGPRLAAFLDAAIHKIITEESR